MAPPLKDVEKDWEPVINAVQPNEYLYNPQHPDYNDRVKRKAKWAEIGMRLQPQCNGDTAYKQWKAVKDMYDRKKREASKKSGSDADDYLKKWPWSTHMSFVDKVQTIAKPITTREWSVHETLRLIAEVKAEPDIWKNAHTGNGAARDEAWKKIGPIFSSISQEELRRKWRFLRNSYSRWVKNDTEANYKVWVFREPLRFLRSEYKTLDARPTTSATSTRTPCAIDSSLCDSLPVATMRYAFADTASSPTADERALGAENGDSSFRLNSLSSVFATSTTAATSDIPHYPESTNCAPEGTASHSPFYRGPPCGLSYVSTAGLAVAALGPHVFSTPAVPSFNGSTGCESESVGSTLRAVKRSYANPFPLDNARCRDSSRSFVAGREFHEKGNAHRQDTTSGSTDVRGLPREVRNMVGRLAGRELRKPEEIYADYLRSMLDGLSEQRTTEACRRIRELLSYFVAEQEADKNNSNCILQPL